jgi:hypothetical protein
MVVAHFSSLVAVNPAMNKHTHNLYAVFHAVFVAIGAFIGGVFALIGGVSWRLEFWGTRAGDIETSVV